MSALRTQIYLTEEQRHRIDDLASSEGLTLAEIVRRALDAYLPTVGDTADALRGTFGAAPDITAPDRDDWSRG